MSEHAGCACSRGNPMEILKSEHRVIERVLDAFERFAAQERIDADAFCGVLDFLRNFADGCHHAKEENELFPQLERAGVPRAGGPIGRMFDDHAQGRALLRRLAENLDAAERGAADAAQTVRAAATQYIDLLRQHIWKEDNILFAMADRVLAPPQRRELLDGFDRAEHAQGDADKHERYVRLADELYNRSLGRTPSAAVRTAP